MGVSPGTKSNDIQARKITADHSSNSIICLIIFHVLIVDDKSSEAI